MSTNLNTSVTNKPVEQDCEVWDRLQSEREDICEALLKEPLPGSGAAGDLTTWHKDLLQARLRKIDDALDRLSSGTYGDCSKCGRWIEDHKLNFDPAIEFCLDCWGRELGKAAEERRAANVGQNGTQAITTDNSVDQAATTSAPEAVMLASLARFDTIKIQTRNSDYRIFMLDPNTGRALVEGGLYFVEPVEARVSGATSGSACRNGAIVVGLRLEMWVNGKLASTSPVKSVRVTHCALTQPVAAGVSDREM